MSTYWIVIAITVIAALLVLLTIWNAVAPASRRRQPRWVALGASGTAGHATRGWVALLAERLSGVEGIDLAAPGATLVAVQQEQLGPALSSRPAVAVIHVGIEDLLHGMSLEMCLVALSSIVERLQQAECQVVVIGMVNIRLSGSENAAMHHDRPLRKAMTEWVSAFDATAHRLGATLVRPSGPDAVVNAKLAGSLVVLDPAFLEAIAHSAAPVVRRALASPFPVSAASDDWDQPADPRQRRVLGLPRVR